jgi:phosphoribosylamine---glycine ligase
MNILLLGSGGREHALAWKMKQSALCSQIFIAPGNAGTSEFGENVNLVATDFEALKKLCIDKQIEMIVVGPEEPLVKGIYDFFTASKDWKGIVIGPSQAGAQLEGSKAFSKHFMQRHNIPTAAYAEFDETNYEEGKEYISKHSLPIVLKADGLAAGKGVIICNTTDEALQSFEEMIVNKQFGEASSKVVIEEFLQGIEVSVFVLTDGKDYKIIGHAKDYKRIGEGDSGLNTGGMGCVSPVPFVDDEFMRKVDERIIKPTIHGLQKEQLEYKGFVFVGLMNVNGEPYVIEYNCRMGDPETEVVMPRLKNDIVEMFVALHNGQLAKINVEFDERAAATVMAVSGGYPGDYKKGIPINFETNDRSKNSDLKNEADNSNKKHIQSFQSLQSILVFHAGTKLQGDEIVTNGGRVLAVTAYGDNIKEAVQKSLTKLQEISFEGMYYRKDIGFEFD